MEKVKSKRCDCGNIIELWAKIVADNEHSYMVTGALNTDVNMRCLCTCYKVYNFHAALERWVNKNQPNRQYKSNPLL